MDYPIIISSEANVYYYSGLNSSNALLILYNNEKIIITDSRYEEAAGKTGLNVAVTKGGNDIVEVALEILSGLGCEKIGYEDYNMLAKDYLRFAQSYKMIPVSKEFLKVRAKKDENEVTKMLTASKIASLAFDKAFEEAKEGITETALAALIDFQIRASGCQGNSFDTIVAFGKNASMPHHEPDNTVLKSGDCVLIDLGAKFAGYCSDMTRMFYMGQPSSIDKEIYEITLEAQERAISAIRDGAFCKNIDSIARDYIKEKGYGKCFGHGTGHGVGLEIHEFPTLNQASLDVLETGMVVTVEPGIYLPGQTGVRIEDMLLVTRDGCINLTSTDKKMKIK
ncbi:MAG: aminopeptidase P family protein [Clostridia bacterium]|nr:aminopeptidase P family protein [Clostridia bacterium]